MIFCIYSKFCGIKRDVLGRIRAAELFPRMLGGGLPAARAKNGSLALSAQRVERAVAVELLDEA